MPESPKTPVLPELKTATSNASITSINGEGHLLAGRKSGSKVETTSGEGFEEVPLQGSQVSTVLSSSHHDANHTSKTKKCIIL